MHSVSNNKEFYFNEINETIPFYSLCKFFMKLMEGFLFVFCFCVETLKWNPSINYIENGIPPSIL